MHVASVSKLVTAMAMTRVLEYYNISPDTPIWPYLPKYWSRGPGIDQMTFRHLLTHRSGLVVPGAPGACDYLFMKDRIAHGASGMPGYLNINYALCRILISTIDASFLFDLLPTYRRYLLGPNDYPVLYSSMSLKIFSPRWVWFRRSITRILTRSLTRFRSPCPVTIQGTKNRGAAQSAGTIQWMTSFPLWLRFAGQEPSSPLPGHNACSTGSLASTR